MARNWIATASRALGIVRADSARQRRQGTSLVLENLEYRLSLSSYSAGAILTPAIKNGPVVPQDLNPTLPPGVTSSQASHGQSPEPAILFPVFTQ